MTEDSGAVRISEQMQHSSAELTDESVPVGELMAARSAARRCCKIRICDVSSDKIWKQVCMSSGVWRLARSGCIGKPTEEFEDGGGLGAVVRGGRIGTLRVEVVWVSRW